MQLILHTIIALLMFFILTPIKVACGLLGYLWGNILVAFSGGYGLALNQHFAKMAKYKKEAKCPD